MKTWLRRNMAACCGILISLGLLYGVLLAKNTVPVTPVAPRVTTPEVSYDDLELQTVLIRLSDGSASGVLTCRYVSGEPRLFVWTCGHVVVSADGVTARDEFIVERETLVSGVMKCTISSEAKVVAWSHPDTGVDLALLEVTNPKDFGDIPALRIDARVPKLGSAVIHVGCPVGLYGSLSFGCISMVGRDFDGVYDQTSCMAYPGSSGGGVYNLQHECIGLVTLGVGAGINFITPMHTMVAWAEEHGVLWALDGNVEVPLTRSPTKFEVQNGR